MDELIYRIALTRVPQVGAVTAKNLISYCGSAEAVFSASKKTLARIPGVGELVADGIVRGADLQYAEKETLFLEQHDIRALFHTDKEYPYRLKNFHDAPLMLFYKGTVSLNPLRSVAIVGTRTPTPAGRTLCEELVEGLRQYDPLIVSGLAYGVDVVAHRKCVDLDVPNIGVLGAGLRNIYPKDHQTVAAKMCENGGLLTEFNSEVRPEAENFPMRNRIIAGMCDAIVVVETAKKGGSMITANIAFSYDRSVFAFPGRPGDKLSLGCNYLIRSNKAALVESAQDVAQMMGWDDATPATLGRQPKLFEALEPEEERLLYLLKSEPETPIDRLIRASGLAAGEAAALLLTLEFKGLIRSLPGKRYAAI